MKRQRNRDFRWSGRRSGRCPRRLRLESLESRCLLAGIPVAEIIGLPAQPLLGSQASFTVRFDNTSPDDPGFGPYVDLYLPSTGADGSTVGTPDDGITFVSAAYGNAGLSTTVLTFGPDTNGNGIPDVEHPFAQDATGALRIVDAPAGFVEGDQLVVFELPFGSFAPDQPPADITVTVAISELADVDTPLPIQVQGGFQFGNDALDNPTTDPPILGPSDAATVQPTVLTLEKSKNTPESETVTGPNFPRTYTITVDIADGQTLNDFEITDLLDNNLQFLQIVSISPAGGTPTATPPTTGPANPPDNELTIRWPSVTGGPGGSDVQVVIEFFVPDADADGNPVLDPTTGDDTTTVNDVRAEGDWVPSDPRDPPSRVVSDTSAVDDTLTDKSIAVQKSVTIVDDRAPAGLSPGDGLEYTIEFQVSDYFAFDNVVLTDVYSDGQVLEGVPRLQVADGHGTPGAYGPADFDSTNYTLTAAAGPDTLEMRVSDELAFRSFSPNGQLVGGGIPAGGTGGSPFPLPPPFGATRGTVTYRTRVQQQYEGSVPGTPNIDHGDSVGNDVTIAGDLVSVDDLQTPTGSSEEDTSGSQLTVPIGQISKSIYALNGSTSLPNPIEVAPGDELTYRLQYTLPTSDIDDLVLTDYLPLPVFDASEVTVFNGVVDASAPAVGTAKFGPADTFFSLSGTVPGLTLDTVSNSLRFAYGDYADDQDRSTVIDILFTVTVIDDPAADRLKLTNQVLAQEANTFGSVTGQDDIITITLGEPVIAGITKGVVATDNPNGVFQPTPVGPVPFTPPGSSGNRFTGTINSANLAANPIDSDLFNVDAQDLVTFAITVENTGSSRKGVFDVTIQDTLPAGFQPPGIGAPPDGINLQVRDGAGDPIPYQVLGGSLFAGGIVLQDPPGGARGALGPGVVGGVPVTDGSNIAIITYDLRTVDTLALDTLTNTATLTNFAGVEGGPDFTGDDDLEDDALVVIANANLQKQLVQTEIEDTFNERREAVVGELITYRVAVTVPEGITPGAVLTDLLDPELGFVEQVAVDIPAGVTLTGDTTPSVSADRRNITWDLGDITNANASNDVPEQVVFTYTVVPLNTLSTNANDNVNNRALFDFTGLGNSLQSSAPDVQILEPRPVIDKSATTAAGAGRADAGDPVTYTIVIDNPPGPDQFTADAFDVTFRDPLPVFADASLILNPAFTVTDTAGIVDNSFFELVGDINAGYTLQTTMPFDLPVDPNREITITITGNIAGSVPVGLQIINESQICWTSLSGDPGQRIPPDPADPGNPAILASTERTGEDYPGGPNDYCAQDDALIQIDSANLDKTLVATSEDATALPSRVVVGEIVRYRLEVQVPETFNSSAIIEDRLPPGLQFVDDGTAVVAYVSDTAGNLTSTTVFDPSPGVAPELNLIGNETNVDSIVPEFPLPDSVIANLPLGDGDDLIIDFGAFANLERDGNGEFVIIEFNALVTNAAGNQQGTPLPNDFIVRVNNLPGTAPSPSATVTVAEPVIRAPSKTTLQTGPFDAGDTVTYSVQYSNGIGPNVSTAYDVRLVDPLPAAKMTLDLASIQVFRNGTQITTGFTDNSAGSTIDITVDEMEPGDVITVLYDAVLRTEVAAGEEIRNAVDVTYTSLPGPNGTASNPTGSANTGTPGSPTGERDGSGGINDYFVGTEKEILIVRPFLGKTITNTDITETTDNQFRPDLPDLAVGEIVTYTLTIFVPEGTTPLRLTDQLPTGADGEMQVVSSRVVSIGSNISGSALNPGDAGTITSPASVEFAFGTVVNTPDNVVDAADRITVQVVAQVLNQPINQAGKVLQNEAVLDYQLGIERATASAEVVEPELEIIKEVIGDDTLDASPPPPAPANPIVTYRVTLRHTDASTAIAFSPQITDTLPDSLQLLGASIVYQPDYSATSFWNPAVLTTSGNTVTLDADWLDHPDSPVSAGILDEIVIEYTARVKGPPEADAADPCDIIENTATVDYDSYFLPSDTNPEVSRPYDTDDTAQIAINCNSISGVNVDLNDNGIYEPGTGETLITEPVTLRLTGTDHLGNAVDRTVTTTTGTYLFDLLRPSDTGSYTVTQVNQPTAYVDGRDTHGTLFGGTDTQGGDPRDADAIAQIVIPLDSNADAVDYNFGELPPARIADFVWEDLNGNGRQDAGEPGLDGVLVDLAGTDTSGNPISRSTTTAGGGLYEFADLRPGDYVVTFTPPAADYVFTVKDSPVAADTTDSDADPNTGATPAVTLAIGEDNPTIDAGLYRPITIGDFVWYDINGDGIQDPGEPGIPGATVTVTWYGPDGVPGGGDDVPYTTTTDAGGLYQIDDLPPGAYGAEVTGQPNGLTTPTLEPAPFDLVSGTDRFDIDFGFTGSGSIGDFVWNDQDGDGQQDTGEPGIPGVAITLTWYGFDGAPGGGDDLTYTTSTDAAGNYLFPDLPSGSFVVDVDATTVPGNLSLTTPPDPRNVTLGVGETNLDVDFGYAGDASVGDRVWYDVNGDGVQDAGEPGIAGAEVTLTFGGLDGDLTTAADNITYVTTTDGNGNYLFSGLPVGAIGAGPNYRAELTDRPAIYTTPTFDLDGIATADLAEFVLQAGENRGDVDFGYGGTAQLGDFVWEDLNGNGLQDGGEPGIAGVTVELLDATGAVVLATTSTDGNGIYAFPGLAAGDYGVRFSAPAGFVFTVANQGGDDGLDSDAGTATGFASPASLATGETNNTVDAGLYQPITIGDFVWYDVNGDGVQDPGEPGIPGATVTVTWYGPDGVPGGGDDVPYTATTDAGGNYQITDLPPGAYGAAVTGQPNGLTTPTFDPSPFDLVSGTDRFDIDFGFTGSGSIGDLVWYDVDTDGTSAGEPGIAGVTVDLVWFGFDGVQGTADDVAYQTTTDVSGNYLFDGLPLGGFQVTVDASTLPSALFATYDLDDGLNNPDGSTAVALTPADANEDAADFGFTGVPLFGDRVWLDYNGDGVQDAGEPGLNGVQVTATWAGPDGNLDTAVDNVTLVTTTNNDGNYIFARLPSGLWRTEITGGLPPGVSQTFDLDGTLDEQTEFILGDFDTRLDIDFGYQGNSSLAGYVYRDFDIDGVREPAATVAETGIGGITVTLTGTDVAGNSVTVTTVTAADGSYDFPGLIPGDYTITEIQPAPPPGGFFDGLDTVGTINGAPVGSSPAKNQLSVTLDVNEQGSEYNFGENPPTSVFGFVYIDLDQNGSRDAGEPGIPNVQVTVSGTAFPGTPLERPLTAADVGGGSLVVTTGPDGRWEFPVLPPGDYQFVQTQPLDYLDGQEENAETFPAPPVTIGDDIFSDVLTYPVIDRGPLNFGEIAINGRLAGSVYVDQNDSNSRDPGEVGIPGVTVLLQGTDLAGNPVSASVVTDANGDFAFERLLPGTYELIQVQPTEFLDGQDRAGSLGGAAGDDVISGIVVGPNEQGEQYLFGELGLLNISKRDFLTSSDPDLMDRDPGSGVTFVNPLPGDPQVTGLAALNLGQVAMGGSLSGSVYWDRNNNGRRDGREVGIPGVMVLLEGADFAGNPVSVRVVTDAQGNYAFERLAFGTYDLVQIQPYEYRDGKDRPGSLGGQAGNDIIAGIVVGPNERGVNYLFGERGLLPQYQPRYLQRRGLPPVQRDPGSGVVDVNPTLPSTTGAAGVGTESNSFHGRLSGAVYVDRDNDGRRDPGEVGIPGVTVLVRGSDYKGDSLEARVVTDADGHYAFERLPAGKYDLVQVHPQEFRDGKDRAGSLGGRAGNDNLTGIAVRADEEGVDYLFGERGLQKTYTPKYRQRRGLPPIQFEPGSGITVVTPLGESEPPNSQSGLVPFASAAVPADPSPSGGPTASQPVTSGEGEAADSSDVALQTWLADDSGPVTRDLLDLLAANAIRPR